jgi:hypothetical protein
MSTNLRDAIADAVEAVEGIPEEVQTPVEETEVRGPEDATEPQSSPDEDDASKGAPEQESEPTFEATGSEEPEGTDEVPETFAGVDLSDIPVEKRKVLIENALQQERQITKLQQRLAEGKDPEEAEPPGVVSEQEPEPESVSDEDIARYMGLSTEDPFYDVQIKVAAPLVRNLLLQQQLITEIHQRQLEDETAEYWHDELDRLEAERGKLPVDRDVLFEFAAENSLYEPVDAYNRIVMGYQKILNDKVGEVRRKTLEELEARRELKREATTPRPGTSVPTEEEVVKAASLKDAIVQAARLAESESGTSWEEAAGAFR